MNIGEPFEIAMMIIKRPSATFMKFRERPPLWQMFILYFIMFAGVASYVFSYLSSEADAAKLKQYCGYSISAMLAVLFFFIFVSMAISFNARLLFGRGSMNAMFASIFYSFLAFFLYIVLPAQLVSFFMLPPDYEYWFTIITRSAILSYYVLTLTIAVSRVFQLSLARGFVAIMALPAYVAFFAASVFYIARYYGIRLY